MLTFGIQLISLLSAKQIGQIRYSQMAFFAAEGALYETIQHLRNDASWPLTLPDESEYEFADVEIERVITESESGLQIDIAATIKDTKRRLTGYYQLSEEPPDPDVNVTYEDLEFKDRDAFIVPPGHSYVEKTTVGGFELNTYINTSETEDMEVEDCYDCHENTRRWYCAGICPDFDGYDGGVWVGGEQSEGMTIKVGYVAILDDDDDSRRTRIKLNGTTVKTCEQGMVTPPCEYTLQEGESGEIRVIFNDSVGVDTEPYVVERTEGGFWFHEEVPEPD